jgi:hypothetical protein
LTSTPDTGSSATTYSVISESNGLRPASPFGAGEARYAQPSSSWLSNGVFIRTDPTFDPSGHAARADVNSFVSLS